MFKFFLRKEQPFQYSTKSYPKMDYIRRRYTTEISRLLQYYRNRNKFINNSHILVRALSYMLPEMSLDNGRFFARMKDNAEYLSKHFRFTNNISTGKLHENVFYSSNSYALINTVSSDINMFFLKYNWKEQRPIRVTYTTSTDLDYYIFDKSKYNKSNTPILMAVEIDFALMGMMYKYWYREQVYLDNNTSVARFISNYILPSMIISNFDLVMFNRFKYMFYKQTCPSFDIDHPFYLVDLSKGIDDVMKEAVKYISNASFPIEQILANIPTLFNDMQSNLWINNLNPTRQAIWSLWLSKLEYMVFLIELMGERGVARNKDRLYHLPRYIKQFENQSISNIINKLPLSISGIYYGNIEKLKLKVGRR